MDLGVNVIHPAKPGRKNAGYSTTGTLSTGHYVGAGVPSVAGTTIMSARPWRGPMASYHAGEVEEEGASHQQDNCYRPLGS